ncbi:MAG: hypothetical protein JWR10_4719 [Rubritepida sp.]|nr:hypothetical protein [Rubritepida sp.]
MRKLLPVLALAGLMGFAAQADAHGNFAPATDHAIVAQPVYYDGGRGGGYGGGGYGGGYGYAPRPNYGWGRPVYNYAPPPPAYGYGYGYAPRPSYGWGHGYGGGGRHHGGW